MATKKKLLQAAAGTAAASGGAGGLNVEDVFSTYVFTGNNSTQTITNGIDLSGEGGLVWTKSRGAAEHPNLYDTERGVYKILRTTLTNAESTNTNSLTAFNTDGFTLGTGDNANYGTYDAVSWTFRKAPKFFTCLTYTGTGTAQNISHDLGTTVGTLIVKRTDSADNWTVWHRGVNSGSGSSFLNLNLTSGYSNSATRWNSTAPTSTQFSVGTHASVNASGGSYVAYLFAHNDGDGDFGPTGDQDVIKCGSYTGNGSTNGPEINLGFEPQWLLIKVTSGTTDQWVIFDTMRGLVTGGADNRLFPNLSNAEGTGIDYIEVTPTGFKPTVNADLVNRNTSDYIYIAIRRGPMAVPTAATDVFAIDQGDTTSNPNFYAGFPVDLGIWKDVSGAASWRLSSRLIQGKFLATDNTNAEASNTAYSFDHQDAWLSSTMSTDYYSWMWKRAPSFCDVVTYTGTGTTQTVSHNLGVAPEMMWIKQRDATQGWAVYHSGAGTGAGRLESTAAWNTGNDFFNSTAPTSSVFTVHTANRTNTSGGDYIAYLFASLDGVSKVGSYTGNGTNQNIDCGFSSGARFVLIKAASTSGQWAVWDTQRGIVAGDDSTLYLDSTVAADTDLDFIDPYSSGFNITNLLGNYNASGVTYIFYAVA